MPKLSEAQLLELDFQVKSINLTNSEFNIHNDPGIDSDYIESWCAGYCTLEDANSKIAIELSWIAQGGNTDYKSAFDFEISVNEFVLTGFELIDEDGETVEGWERNSKLSELLNNVPWESQIQAELPKAETEELEMTELNGEFKEYTINRDNGPDLKFVGEIIGESKSSSNNASGSSYSGSTGRWKELTLFKTKSGKFICQLVERTQWQGERDRFKAAVCETEKEVIDFFGYSWLAKELYDNANIEAFSVID